MNAPAIVHKTPPAMAERAIVAGPGSGRETRSKINWPSLLAKLALVFASLLVLSRLRALIPARVLRVLASLTMLGVVITLMVAARLLPTGVLLRFAQRLC